MAETAELSQEKLAHLKLRLHERWRRLAFLRRQVNANKLVPYSEVTELATRKEELNASRPLKNVALETRLRFHQFRGAYVRRVAHSLMYLQFNSSHRGRYLEQFMIQLEAQNGKYKLVKASLPLTMSVSKLKERLYAEDGNLLEFIQYVQACVDAYTFRQYDYSEFKELATKQFGGNLQRSLNLRFVHLTVLLRDSSGRLVVLNVTLDYNTDSCIPTDMKVTTVSEDDIEFATESENTLNYFLALSLCEAFAVGVKEEGNEMLTERNSSGNAALRTDVEADHSQSRSARRVLAFDSPVHSSSDASSEGSSSEEKTRRRPKRTLRTKRK